MEIQAILLTYFYLWHHRNGGSTRSTLIHQAQNLPFKDYSFRPVFCSLFFYGWNKSKKCLKWTKPSKKSKRVSSRAVDRLLRSFYYLTIVRHWRIQELTVRQFNQPEPASLFTLFCEPKRQQSIVALSFFIADPSSTLSSTCWGIFSPKSVKTPKERSNTNTKANFIAVLKMRIVYDGIATGRSEFIDACDSSLSCGRHQVCNMSRIAGSTDEVAKMVNLAPFYQEFSRYCEYYLDKRDRICKGVIYGEICIRRLTFNYANPMVAFKES